MHRWSRFFTVSIFFETPLPKKQTNTLTKFCPSFIGQNFASLIFRFLSNGVSRIIAFEIYWPLVACSVQIYLPNEDPHYWLVGSQLRMYLLIWELLHQLTLVYVKCVWRSKFSITEIALNAWLKFLRLSDQPHNLHFLILRFIIFFDKEFNKSIYSIVYLLGCFLKFR